MRSPSKLTSRLNSMVPYLAMAVVVIGFALRLYNLASESLWYDELLQLDIAQQPLNTLLPALPIHSAVPLDYIITHFWIILGQQEFWVRLPAVLLGTLTLPLAYQLGRRLLGSGEGLLLMLLLTFSPFHIQYSQEVRPYALLLLGIIIAGIAWWGVWRSGRWWYLGALQLGVLLFSLAHLFSIVILGPWLLFIVLVFLWGVLAPSGATMGDENGGTPPKPPDLRRNFQGGQHREHPLKAFGGLLITGFITLLILLALGWGTTFVRVSTRFSETIVEPEKSTASPADKPNQGSGPRLDWNFVQDKILSPLGAGGQTTALWLFNALAGLGLLYLLLQRRYKLLLLLVLWLFLPIIFIVAFLVHRGEFFAPRYILSVLPAYLMLVASGIVALPRWLKTPLLSGLLLLLLGSVVILSMSRGLNDYYDTLSKEDWRLVTKFIAQNAQPEDTVIAVNAERTLNWYYPSATAADNSYDDLESIQTVVTQSERSWVIVSIFAAYLGERDARIKAWLSEQGAIRLVIDPLIEVYYLGPDTSPDQLLAEIQQFALPVNHSLYASLARENRHQPEIARSYFQLAIEHAPDEATRAQYKADLEVLTR